MIACEGNRLRFIACGSVETHERAALSERLVAIHDGLHRVVEDFAPDEAAVEAVEAAVRGGAGSASRSGSGGARSMSGRVPGGSAPISTSPSRTAVSPTSPSSASGRRPVPCPGASSKVSSEPPSVSLYPGTDEEASMGRVKCLENGLSFVQQPADVGEVVCETTRDRNVRCGGDHR